MKVNKKVKLGSLCWDNLDIRYIILNGYEPHAQGVIKFYLIQMTKSKYLWIQFTIATLGSKAQQIFKIYQRYKHKFAISRIHYNDLLHFPFKNVMLTCTCSLVMCKMLMTWMINIRLFIIVKFLQANIGFVKHLLQSKPIMNFAFVLCKILFYSCGVTLNLQSALNLNGDLHWYKLVCNGGQKQS
jgi:hypothetical protein